MVLNFTSLPNTVLHVMSLLFTEI